MNESDYDYSEPWPIYADEDYPHRDLERLRKLAKKMELEEMADALGCHPNTVRKWYKKAMAEAPPDQEEMECEFFAVCENETPGPNNEVCDTCLDLQRHNTRLNERYKTKGVDAAESDSMIDHMQRLYDEYSDLVKD